MATLLPQQTPLPPEIPVLPLRQAVVFPLTVQPLAVNRPVSMASVNRALAGERMLLLVMQGSDTDDPPVEELKRGRHGGGHPADGEEPRRAAGARRGHRPRADRRVPPRGRPAAGAHHAAPRGTRTRASRWTPTSAAARAGGQGRVALERAVCADLPHAADVARRSAAPGLHPRDAARHEARGQAAAARAGPAAGQARTRSPAPCSARSPCSS